MTIYTVSVPASVASSMKQMERDIDHLFGLQQSSSERRREESFPPVDYYKANNTITIHADLPGVPKENVSIDFHEGHLTLSGESKITHAEDKSGQVHLQERFNGKFSRTFKLPEGATAEGAKASFDMGVLTITIPIEAPHKAIKINIE